MTAQELNLKSKQEVQEKELTHAGRHYVPDVDIFEDQEALTLWIEMPGVEIENVDIQLNNETVNIEGRVSLTAYEGLTPHYTEYNVGHYFRRFSLANVARFDSEGITARMKKGILEVRLPKSENARNRRIEVMAA